MRVVLLGLLLGVSVAAQGYIAYPADTLHGMLGQIIPLGASTSGSFAESRTQHLIPAWYLPPVVDRILAIDVAPHVTGTVHYQSLDIYFGHTTAGSLTTAFATNLPKPVLVYSQANFSASYPSRTQWVTLPLGSPFLYDGQSSLIIETRKVINRTAQNQIVSHQTLARPTRRDLPQPLFAWGPLGSGAAKAATGRLFPQSSHLMFRLHFQTAGVLSIASTLPSGKDLFHLGATVTLSVHGNSGEIYFTALDFGRRTTPLVVPGINGRYWLPGFNVIFIGQIPSSGRGKVVLQVPNIPSIVGTYFAFQAARYGATFDFTNIVDGFIAP